MKQIILFILLSATAQVTFSQQSDFIVLKKRNNRTIKTYYPGIFISALTHNGFRINGFIKDIRNDSIIILQQETQLVAADFGTKLDTLSYTIGMDYREIKKFNYTRQYVWGRKKGFVQVTLPRLMKIGGTGFVILELVNTIYRKESLNDSKKLTALGIAAGVAVAGFAMSELRDFNNKAGGKYKVVYVKNTK